MSNQGEPVHPQQGSPQKGQGVGTGGASKQAKGDQEREGRQQKPFTPNQDKGKGKSAQEPQKH